MIPGDPNPKGAPAAPGAPATPVDEEAHFRLDEHQRQIDELRQGDMKALVRSIESLVQAIRELIATREV